MWKYYIDELSGYKNNNNNPKRNLFNSETFKYMTSITGSTYNVDARITNAEGNEINNPADDLNKSGTTEVEIAVSFI